MNRNRYSLRHFSKFNMLPLDEYKILCDKNYKCPTIDTQTSHGFAVNPFSYSIQYFANFLHLL